MTPSAPDGASDHPIAPRWGNLDRLAVTIVVLLPMLRASIFPELQLSVGFYYTLLGGVIGIILLRGIEHLRFDPLLSALAGCALLSIAFNDIPDFFHPWQRWIGWLFILGLCSHWLKNEYFRLFRTRLCRCFDAVLMISVVGSLIGHVSGITPRLHDGQANGLFAQSMLLGPIAAIASLLFLHRTLTSAGRSRFWWGICFLMALVTVLLASSRGALFSLLFGMAFYLFVFLNFRKALLGVLLAVFLAYVTFSYWQGYTETLQNKFESGIERSGSIFDSRQAKWEMRWEEMKDSPWFGCGFSAVGINGFFWADEGVAGVEPGSGWLFVFSSMGIPAGILFVIFMVLPFFRFFLYKTSLNTEVVLRLAIFAFFGGHLCIEGYVISSGSPLCVLFWLYSSRVYDLFDRSAVAAEHKERKAGLAGEPGILWEPGPPGRLIR